jgi:adenine-specific DNA-methyltransferase
MSRSSKLELTWIGKENRPKLEPRILIEDPALSYHAPHRVCEDDIFDNRLIFGDNLLALKSLEQEFAGRVKCVYIDPPFNTGQAFEYYDDCLEHSTWLALMSARLELLYRLLAPEGVLFVHLDQEENHYLKVVADELFGRRNFLGQVAYERSGVSGIGQGGSFLVNTHEYILCYAKDRARFHVEDDRGAVPLEPKDMKRYNRMLVSRPVSVRANDVLS